MAKGTTETKKMVQKELNKKVEKKDTINISSKEKNSSKATNTIKKTNTKKTSKSNNISKKKTTTKNTKVTVVEYYDLPYRYNQTIVKILAQTPTTLFVYWDISDKDREKYLKDFGKDFFNASKPILIVHNTTKNTSFEVEINDFANSWYLKNIEPNCTYEIELGRKIFDENKLKENLEINSNEFPIFTNHIHNESFISITNSNYLETPNDHVLLENVNIGTKIEFKIKKQH